MAVDKELDCRGLRCPQPVIDTRDALERPGAGAILVRVDNEAARDNVGRFARSRGCTVEVTEEPGGFRLLITAGGETAKVATRPEGYRCGPAGGRLVGIIDADTMGRGDEKLGRVLMLAFIKTLVSLSPPPAALYFYNAGVRLTAGDSELIEPLQTLAAAGCRIYSCGTCLDFYNLKDDLRVGEVTNMFDIVQAMATANSVLRP